MLLNADIAIKAFADAMGLQVQTVTQKLTLDAWTGITKRSPVATGRSRASWNIQEKTPSTRTPPPGTYGPPPTPKITVSGAAVVYVSSNVDYVEYLEEGSSKQAPAGMVAVTLIELEVQAAAITAGSRAK